MDISIEHFGVKGMRWGVRKRQKEGASPESAKASALRKKAKTSGVASLTNAEVQALITRTNLENQYRQQNPTLLQQGSKFATSLLMSMGKQQAQKLLTDALVKQVPKLIKK